LGAQALLVQRSGFMSGELYKVYPHNPPHLFCPQAIYMVTAATLRKRHLLDSDVQKSLFLRDPI